MKKTILAMAMLGTMLVFSACDKEQNDSNAADTTPAAVEPTSFEILHTSWQGSYTGTVVHPQAGNLPCSLTWTLDFVDESNVSILLEMSTDGQAQDPKELSCTYTYDGLHGELVSEEDGESQRDPFDVDPINRTLTLDLRITTGFSQERPQVVGGPTVFHQIH